MNSTEALNLFVSTAEALPNKDRAEAVAAFITLEKMHTKKQNRINNIEQKLKELQLGTAKDVVAKEWQKLVKLRWADENGICTCVTSGERFRIGDMKLHAGHYWSRRHSTTLFHPMNCHPQSAYDNKAGGNIAKYTEYMEATYTREELIRLERLKNTTKQFTRRALAELKVAFFDGQKRELKRIEEGRPSTWAWYGQPE